MSQASPLPSGRPLPHTEAFTSFPAGLVLEPRRRQVLPQPILVIGSAVSHASPNVVLTTPSPHVAAVFPVNKQLRLQPAVLIPISQSSPASILPLPHTGYSAPAL